MATQPKLEHRALGKGGLSVSAIGLGCMSLSGIYGAAEEDTLCPALTQTGIEVVKTTGDHHFGGDYNVLARRILTSWQKQIAART